MKKIFRIILVSVLCISMLTVCSFADRIVRYKEVTYDTSHGRHLACNSADTFCLNVYTSTTPKQNDRVTTWKSVPGDKAQLWEFGRLDGRYIVATYSNKRLALNIMRTSTSATAELVANLWMIENNYYDDTCLEFEMLGSISNGVTQPIDLVRIAAPARSSYNRRYLDRTSTGTPVSDGQGTSNYCAFNTSGDIFYDVVQY